MFQLRVVWPEDGGDADTMAEWWGEAELLLSAGGRCGAATLAEYRATVAAWAAGPAAAVPLAGIGQPELLAFCAFCAARAGRHGGRLSAATVAKHARHVRALLRLAGPRSAANWDGVGRLAELPALRLPRVAPRAPRGMVPWSTLGRVVAASAALCRPQQRLLPCVRAVWWRAVLLTGIYTGLRPCALLRLRWDDVGPPEDGWRALLVRAAVNKGGVEFWHWVHPAAWSALEALPRGEWIFAERWPALRASGPQFVSARRCVSLGLRQALRAAGAQPAGDNVFRVLRKTLATELAKRSELAAQLALGHRAGSVLAMHYAARGVVLRAALEGLGSIDQEGGQDAGGDRQGG